MNKDIKFGEIWIADLSPTNGTEPGKTRPVLIVQSQTLLEIEHPSTLIIPLTANLISNAEPLRIRIKAQDNLEKDSDLLIDQVRAIDNKRLKNTSIASLEHEVLLKVKEAINQVFGFK
jgi:mRNA interferase MazF